MEPFEIFLGFGVQFAPLTSKSLMLFPEFNPFVFVAPLALRSGLRQQGNCFGQLVRHDSAGLALPLRGVATT
jgi:hypothetical protein